MLSLDVCLLNKFWRYPKHKSLSTVCLIKVPPLEGKVIPRLFPHPYLPTFACLNSEKLNEAGQLTWFWLDSLKQDSLPRFNDVTTVRSFAFRPENVTACNPEYSLVCKHGILRYDMELDEILDEPKHGHVEQVAYSPDGKLLATSTENGDVIVWSLKGGRAYSLHHVHISNRPATSLIFSATSDTLFALTVNGSLHEVDLSSDKTSFKSFDLNIWKEDLLDPFCATMSVHPNLPILAFGGDGGFINLWQYHYREEEEDDSRFHHQIKDGAAREEFSRGQASASHIQRRDWKLSTNTDRGIDSPQWIYHDRELKQIPTGISGFISYVKFLPNGLLVAAGVVDDKTRALEVIDLYSKTCVARRQFSKTEERLLDVQQYGNTVYIFTTKP